jgi:glycine hydroxymethyltransferase
MQERRRQFENIELIASENFTSRASWRRKVLPDQQYAAIRVARWCGGCEFMDGRPSPLTAPRSSSPPNTSTSSRTAAAKKQTCPYILPSQPRDRLLTMDLAHGGHLTMAIDHFSGKLYEIHHYGVDRGGANRLRRAGEAADEVKPKVTAGASAYSRTIDFARMRQIADRSALTSCRYGHIAGLVAGAFTPARFRTLISSRLRRTRACAGHAPG